VKHKTLHAAGPEEYSALQQLHRDIMKKLIFYSLVVFICLQNAGCTSMHVIEKARGTPPNRDDAEPAYYSLLPLTVTLDAALVFLYLYAEGQGGGYAPGCSPSSGGGLKVTRP
jgi:hypothetical protein